MDGRHCARPGCDTVAAAKLTYDYARRTVWLDLQVILTTLKYVSLRRGAF